MVLDKLLSVFSSQKDETIDQTTINGKLYKFVTSEVLPGTDVTEKDFWDGFVKAANELAPENRDLLKKRDEIQSKLDEWHKNNKDKIDFEEYKKFLKEIGYLVEEKEKFQIETLATVEKIKKETMDVAGKAYASGPTRVQYQNKDPRGWKEFEVQLREHSTEGSANTMMGVQRLRPSLYDLEDKMRALTVPTMIINGDEDDPCLDPGFLMKRNISSSSLVVLPRSGHTINLEEPAMFNWFVDDFLHQVESGNWGLRDPRSQTGSILGDTGKGS